MRRYYEEEMRYLHEAGKVFAETHPEQARYLNPDSVTDRDPYVERLFEGFAFLTGRIHERLDDELFEYTGSLFQLLYPHFLKPFPSCSLISFRPKSGPLKETILVKRGTEIRSDAVGDERAVCRFHTTSDVRLHPIRLADATLQHAPDGTSNATLRFQLDGGGGLGGLNLSPLRIYFHAAPAVASRMHLFFTRHVRRVVVSGGMGNGMAQVRNELFADSTVTLDGQSWITPGGTSDEEALLPGTTASFSGFRLLQEYLCFRQKFLCIDVHGLERFSPSMPVTSFQVEVFFDEAYPEDRRFKAENLRLFCTPALNLFESDAAPIRVDHRAAEHRIIADPHFRKSLEVYEVDTVVGIEEKTGKRRQYAPYYAFEHATSEEGRYYATTARIGPTGRRETYLSIGDSEQQNTTLFTTILSLDVHCTNGSLPREKLQEGMLNKLAPEFPQDVVPENLTRPTLILYPPTEQQKGFFWKLISHLSLNHQSVATHAALAGVLSLYDWTKEKGNKRRIAGIEDVRWEAKEVMRRGAILRGAEVHIAVQEAHFPDEGDLCLFGLVLSKFLAMYATLNSFVHLSIELKPSGKTYQWQPQNGQRPIL